MTKTYENLHSTWVDPTPEKPPQFPPILKLIQIFFTIFGRIFPIAASRIAYKMFSTPRRRARHKNSDKIMETARIFEFMYGRQILKGYEWGRGAQTILLVHGWESRGTGLRSFVPRLVRSGFRVIAFDGPAHGNSTGTQTNLADFAGAVTAILHNIGEVYGIIGHSFGGIATTYALRHLDKNIKVEKLVFVASPSRTRKVLMTFCNEIWLPKKATQKFIEILEGTLKNVPPTETDIADAEKAVNVEKILVIHDKKDAIVPFAAAEEIYENWECADLLAPEGYGHFRVMKNPDVLDQVAWFMHH